MGITTALFSCLASFTIGYFFGKNRRSTSGASPTVDDSSTIKKLKSEKFFYKSRYDTLVTTRFNLDHRILEVFIVEKPGNVVARMRTVRR